jgi:ATP-dependent DNA helicase RecG
VERGELIERLQGYEWNDVEFKSAQRNVPESAYETVSAFANTDGGRIVFGIQDRSGRFEIVGVLQVDKVQSDFLSVLRSGQKLNRIIAVREQLIQEEDKALLVFYIPESRRQEKPVYLSGDIRRSFIRRGGCDERCTQSEIERLLRDAADERYDGRTVDLDPEHCFDVEAVSWYRRVCYDRDAGQDETLSNLEFLHHWGLVLEVKERLLPTRAALLMFGTEPAFRQILPRPVVDWQQIRTNWSEGLQAERWADRLVIETNLISTWRALLARYLSHAEQPFAVDPETMQRTDRPPDYLAFREAVINLLIHQDYADHVRKPVIQFFNDRTLFWNPGDAFAASEQLLEPGEKEVRNPRIVAAFRRIGLSEQAGTGVRSIFTNWQQLGHVPPDIRNDKTAKSFELTLLKERLFSEQQLLFQASLGVHLNDTEARVFALVHRMGRAHPHDIRALTGLPSKEIQIAFDGLAVQALISPVEDANTPLFTLAEHLKEQLASPLPEGREGLVTDQARPEPRNLVSDQARILPTLSKVQWRIVTFCDIPRASANIMSELGLTHRAFFRRTHLDPLLRGGVLRMTHPDQPNHPGQAYVLTETGVELKVLRAAAGGQEAERG